MYLITIFVFLFFLFFFLFFVLFFNVRKLLRRIHTILIFGSFPYLLIAFDLLLSRIRDCPHDCDMPVLFDATVMQKNPNQPNLSYRFHDTIVCFTDRFPECLFQK